MPERVKRTISEVQDRLLKLLRSGYVIYEERGKDRHSLSYITARINPRAPFAFELPMQIHKETVFAFLANGLLKSIRPWEGYGAEVMVLNEKLPLFDEVPHA
jgi:hypothetical protein